MRGLLGKIVSLQELRSSSDGATFAIKFRPLVVLPERSPVPDWLKGQTLEVERTVVDRRELGAPDENIVLSHLESQKWLQPLVVTPDIVFGFVPKSVELRLLWWKNDKAPEFCVKANGVLHVGVFETDDSGGYRAVVNTESFGRSVPLTLHVECEGLKATSMVLPSNQCGGWPVETSFDKKYRIESVWYSVELPTKSYMGGVSSLREKLRDTEHFMKTSNGISSGLDVGGQYDRYRSAPSNWGEPYRDIGANAMASRNCKETLRFTSESVADDNNQIRTSAVQTYYHAFPLILFDREFHILAQKDKKKDDGAPEELIDSVMSFGMSCRSSSLIERNGVASSRAMITHKGRLLTVRSTAHQQIMMLGGSDGNLAIEDGWALIEHPNRRSYLLYLFDLMKPPLFALWHGVNEFSFEPFWQNTLIKRETSVGFSMGLAAGEAAGASLEGAWVACRRLASDGAIEVGVVARLKEADGKSVRIALGQYEKICALRSTMAPGIGWLSFATASFKDVSSDDLLRVEIEGVEGRQ